MLTDPNRTEEHPLKKGPLTPGFPARVQALIEVIGVALGGTVLVLALQPFLLQGANPLESVALLFRILMVEAVVTLVLIFWFLNNANQTLWDLGWRRGRTLRETIVGILTVPALFGLVISVGIVFRVWFPAYVTEVNPLLDLMKSPQDLVLLLISSIFVGGVKEEIQRAFILHRFHGYLGGVWVGLVLWTLFFGLGHLNQGIDNAAAAGFLGLVFGLLYIWRGSLTSPIIAHAGFDVAMVLFYWAVFRTVS